MRTTIAWIFGLLTFFIANIAFSRLGDSFDVPSLIRFGETVITSTRFYDIESDSMTTYYGYATLGLAFTLAIVVGRAIFFGSLEGAFSREEWLQAQAWLAGLSVAAVTAGVLHLALSQFRDDGGPLGRILELAAMAGVAWSFRQWYLLRRGALRAAQARLDEEKRDALSRSQR